jgi:hypothetical protein
MLRTGLEVTPYRSSARPATEEADVEVARFGANMQRARRVRRLLGLGVLALVCSAPVGPFAVPRRWARHVDRAHAPDRVDARAWRPEVWGTPQARYFERQNAAAFLLGVADDIAALGRRYPKLRDFDVTTDYSRETLSIGYTFHVHEPRGGPGWTKLVPNPDPDGIWLTIDLHAPGSGSQLHAQTLAPRFRVPLGGSGAAGEMILFVLSLEGDRAPSVATEILWILARRVREAGGTGEVLYFEPPRPET